MNPTVTLHAPAKLNLRLLVGEKVQSGLHRIATLICPISLFDSFRITLSTEPPLSAEEVTFECRFGDSLEQHLTAVLRSHPGQSIDVTTLGGPGNLVIKVLGTLFTDGRLQKRLPKAPKLWPVKIEVIKEIPFLAGLGGGSADAALILQILQFLLGLELSPEELYETGSQFGSDIPAALAGCPVVVWGCGERVHLLNEPRFASLSSILRDLWAVVLKPTQGVQTGAAYRLLDQHRLTDVGDAGIRGVIPEYEQPGRCDGTSLIERCLLPGDAVQQVRQRSKVELLSQQGLLGNDFEPCVQAGFPEVGAAFEILRSAGGKSIQLSGSGSTVFALCDHEHEAAKIVDRLEELAPAGWFFKRVRFLTEAFPWSSQS